MSYARSYTNLRGHSLKTQLQFGHMIIFFFKLTRSIFCKFKIEICNVIFELNMYIETIINLFQVENIIPLKFIFLIEWLSYCDFGISTAPVFCLMFRKHFHVDVFSSIEVILVLALGTDEWPLINKSR